MTANYRKTLTFLFSSLLLSLSALSHAGSPVWTFTALTPTTISVPGNGTATVQYTVTNQSSKSHTLVMTPITGITQVTTGAGVCANPFTLSGKGASCTLSLQVNGSQLTGPVSDGPVVCEQGSTLQCYRPSSPDILNISTTTNEYTVGGTVSGLTRTLTLLNNGSDALTTSTDGNFTFTTPITDGGTYAVTVQSDPDDQTCTVNNASGTINSANVTNINVTCSTNDYTVGGTISGLSGTVVLQNNGTNATSISSDGSFTFSTSIAQGSTYAVTVQTQPSTTQTCTVSNGTGTMGGANVTNVSVTCSTNTYTVGGTVSGLSGAVTLLNNGGDNKTVSSSGSFIFSTPLAQGSTYAVTVGTQPTIQTCSVLNGSGTMGGANVTNVGVTCVTNNTTLTVSSTGTIPVYSGAPGSPGTLTVTNTGANIAANVSASLPGAWTGVTQDATGCVTIAANGGTCTLNFTSTTPYVAQGGITVTGDNITSPPTTALAFSIDGYLVWSVSGTSPAATALVLANSDTSTVSPWSFNVDSITGITQESTAPPCNVDIHRDNQERLLINGEVVMVDQLFMLNRMPLLPQAPYLN